MTRSVAPPKSNNYNVDFSKQFLVFGIGFVITLFELALAQWSFLFSSAPMISLCYFYILGLLRPKLLSFITVISLALLFELMGGDMLGVRVTAFYVVALMLKKRIVQSENNDFIAHWANFSLVCLAGVIFRLLMFMMIYFTQPNLSVIAFQIGISILVFPIFFVVISVILSLTGSPIREDA
ncbi:hypothetical protein N9P07_05425 [Alphaproteobacteria bacterium]|nr:hypothetical protein [Alphaproteobacteria bacterium]